MGLAVVGIKVQVDGIAQANLQFRALQASIDQTVASAAKLKGIKVPSTVNIANAFGPNSYAVGAIDKSVRSYTNMGKAAGGAARQLSVLGKVGKTAGMLVSNTASTFIAFGKHVKRIGDNVATAGRRIQSFGSSVTMLGSRMTTFVSLPIVAGIGKAVQAAALFEDQMVNLRTQVDLSEEEVEYFKTGLLKLVPALGKTATELGAAGYTILSKDLEDVDLALKVLEGSAKASAIGLGETQDIASIMTAVMVSYGATNMNAADANEFLTTSLDQLMKAIQVGSLEADEMVEPMGRLLGTASELDVGFAELTAAMGTFGSTGQSASEVVTSINRILASFVKPTKSTLDALAAIDSSWEKITTMVGDNGEGLAQTLFYLRDEFDEAGISITKFFGRLPALNAFFVLTGGGAQLYLNSLDDIRDSAGSLEEAFDITKTKTSFMWEQMKASAEAFAIVLGTHLLPEVNKILIGLQPLIEKAIAFVNLNPELVKMGVAFGLAVAAIGPLLILFGIFVASVGAFITAIGTIVGAIGFLLSPIGALIGLLAAAAAALVGVWLISVKKTAEKSEKHFTSMADAAWTWGYNIVTTLAQGMADAMIAVVNVLIDIGNTITYWLQGQSPPRLLPDIDKWGTTAMDEYLGGFTLADFSVFDDIAGLIEKEMRSMGDSDDPTVPQAIEHMREMVAKAMTSGTGFTDEILNEITFMFGALSDNTRKYITTLVELAAQQKIVKDAQSEISAATKKYEDAMKPLNDELEAFARFGEELNDADRKRVLERRLKDPRTSAMERELILMDLRALEIKKIERDLADERDATIDVATARLDAAQAEVQRLEGQAELSRKVIEAQIEQRDLWKEQEEIIKRVEDAATKAGGAIRDALGIRPGGGTDEDDEDEDTTPVRSPLVSNILSNMEDAFGEDGLVGKLKGAFDEIAAMFDPLIGEDGLFNELAEVWSGIFTDPKMGEKTLEILDFAVKLGGVYLAGRLAYGIFKGISTVWTGLGLAASTWKLIKGSTLLSGIGSALGSVLSIPVLAVAAPWILAIAGAITLLGGAIAKTGGWEAFKDMWTGLFDQIVTIKDEIFGVEDEIEADLATRAANADTHMADWVMTTLDFSGQIPTIHDETNTAVGTIHEGAGYTKIWQDKMNEMYGYTDTWATDSQGLFVDTVGEMDTTARELALVETYGENFTAMETTTTEFTGNVLEALELGYIDVETLTREVKWPIELDANLEKMILSTQGYVRDSTAEFSGGLDTFEQELRDAGVTLPEVWQTDLGLITDEIAPWNLLMETGGFDGGANFGAGVTAGVNSKLPALESAIRGAATISKKTWNDYWQVMSPSKVAEKDAGYIMKGYAKGISGQAFRISDAMKSAAADVRVRGDINPSSYSPRMAMAAAGGNTNNSNVTIGPNNISNGIDYASFELMVERAVWRSLG